jgi:hypothetical protein
MIQLPKQGMKNLQIKFYRGKTRQSSKKSFPGCKKMPEIKSEMSITSRKFLNPSIKSSLKTWKLLWGLSQIWTFIMWQ